jgi:hypothetical protein
MAGPVVAIGASLCVAKRCLDLCWREQALRNEFSVDRGYREAEPLKLEIRSVHSVFLLMLRKNTPLRRMIRGDAELRQVCSTHEQTMRSTC